MRKPLAGSVQSVHLLSHVWLFATPWTAARQASLSITNSWSSPKLMCIESVMPSSHLILCRPLLLLPLIPPSIRVFSNESTLRMSPSRLVSSYLELLIGCQITSHIGFSGGWEKTFIKTKAMLYHLLFWFWIFSVMVWIAKMQIFDNNLPKFWFFQSGVGPITRIICAETQGLSWNWFSTLILCKLLNFDSLY